MDPKKIIKSAGTVSGFTMLSRALGLVRDVLMAGRFGTSLVMSAFVVAFTIPNLFRRLFGEGALSAALVPVLVETREKEGDEPAWTFVNRVLSLTLVVLTAITALVIFAAVLIRPESAKIAAVLDLLQIMMPYMIFICLAAVSMGILNAFHHFAVSAFAPSILNLLWIGTMLFVVPHLGNSPEEKIRTIAWAVLLAGFLQWAVQWPVLRHFGWKPHFSNHWKTPRIRKMLLLMGPAAIGMAVTQINVMVDRLLALWVSAEAPSALFYSERLIYFPLGIIATALGTVLLPVFSGHASRNDPGKIREGVTDGLRHILFVMIPAAVGMLVLARPIVQMIFESGQFSSASTGLTAIALQCYAPGLVVFSLAKIFVPAFYALQDTKTPVKIGACAVALNLALNITFILTLPQGVKHAGIAAATVIAEAFSMVALALILQKRIGKPDWKRVGATAGRALAAAAVMGIVVVGVHGLFSSSGKMEQIVSVVVSIAAGGGVYLLMGRLLRLGEISEFLRAFRR
ncbi:MAG: murein biosynthesis integral membrane protein MurJ [Verrucomicrobia bacterium]|nr:murein biosynthesis integral membrane protein MurJ [Verrucomicrobiota bacterium]